MHMWETDILPASFNLFGSKRGQKMIENKLFTVFKDEGDSEGEMIRGKRTEYLLELQPHEALKELRANVEAIAEQVEDYSKHDLDVPEQAERLRDLIFELELARGYLMEAFKAWQARQ